MFSLNKTTNFLHEPEGKHIAPSLSNLNYWPVNEILEDQYHLPPSTTNIEKNISSHHHYWPKHFLIISEKCCFKSFLFLRCTTGLGGGEWSECWCSLLWGLWINQLIHWSSGANTNPQHFNSWKIYSWVNWADHRMQQNINNPQLKLNP